MVGGMARRVDGDERATVAFDLLAVAQIVDPLRQRRVAEDHLRDMDAAKARPELGDDAQVVWVAMREDDARGLGPPALSRSTQRQISAVTSGASPSVASSRMSRRGFVISARPIASICCPPPDSAPPRLRARAASSGKSSKTGSTRQGLALPARFAAVATRFSLTVRLGNTWRPSGTRP